MTTTQTPLHTPPPAAPASLGQAWSEKPHDPYCRCPDCEHAHWAEVEAHEARISCFEGGL